VALSETDHKNNDGNEVESSENASELPPASSSAMDEYFRLQQNLLLCTLAFTAVIFVSVWWAYLQGEGLEELCWQ
jgi:ATP synthase protein I